MALVDYVSLDRDNTYKGTAYALYGNLASFPGALESVINPTTCTVVGGLTPICPTSEDGVTIARSADVSEGIALDQKKTNWDEGEPSAWTMSVGMTALQTNVDIIKVLWQTPDPVAVTGSVVTQKRLPIGAPSTFTERQLYIVQEDYYTGRMRVFAFRKVVPQPDGEMNIQSEEATGLPVTFKIREDTTYAEHNGSFGYIFEEDAS